DNNVTFFEDVKVTGTEKVTIAETGTLNLRLKNTEETVEVGEEFIPKATHAFSGNKNEMVIQGEGTAGTLRFITNGIGKKIYVDMENIELRNLYFKTSSIIDGYEVNDKVSVILGAYGNLNEIYRPENMGKSHRYEALNNIYKGIYSSTDDNLNALRVLISSNGKLGNNYDENMSDEEQLKNLLSYLGSIYTETPYSFSSELSRKSAGMFRDIITENQFKPNLNQWLIMGGLTHTDGGTKDSYYGQNYHGFDTGTADVDVDMKLTGAYALGKYGYSENVSLGVTVGGNRSEAKLPMSKVKGNSGYIGAFAENYRGNLTLKAGAGIQYSEYDANRATLGGHSYSEKYSDMTYDIYLNGRYSHNIGENLFLEPYGTLSYTYIKQDSADEGSKVLAIETDSKTFDYTAAKVGVDLKKVIPHEKGKSTLSAGVSYTRLLTGADEENITGRFKGENATDFDILVAHKNEQSIGLNAKYALELESGILFDVKGSYNVERDSHNGTGKNRAKGEWIVGAGIGYKF
ncbi:autotransporter outer membrane beta-barrel domain-containing protein, partial [Fusobacterium varium]